MDDVMDSIGRNFERFLRWAYPGALLLVLLRMSKPDAFYRLANLNDVKSPWGLVVGGLVGGFIVYLFQANVLNYAVSLLFQAVNWDVNVGLQRAVATAPQPGWRWLQGFAHLFDRHAQATWDRWGGGLPEKLNNYLNYAWATYHAVFLTGWLTLAFFWAKDEGSLFAIAPAWKILVPAGLLLAGGFWTYSHLSRVPFKTTR